MSAHTPENVSRSGPGPQAGSNESQSRHTAENDSPCSHAVPEFFGTDRWLHDSCPACVYEGRTRVTSPAVSGGVGDE